MPTSGGDSGGRRGGQIKRESLITRAVNSVFSFVRLAEFEILFFAFFVIAFLKFKDLISRPEYNQIFVKKPIDDNNPWPY
ncbi:uncharacterized protein LOC110103432 isoform X2 [Dendrobium catenatum]|uniref:GRIP and coiled-coil domain-containing protein 1 n=2 Tax=Dendrobium TaxID=37818 RepID=A0A2I0WZG4_9ASPA|nr:uncharacterized protein LOC110103432 isoform X2 [Dendrobium catenatum]KAH0467333.1 hypothetical protein IEQ34_004571 [Dendrobium chrysotoxum]PKU81048.1 hypothetical protein MA16_Dca024020 [Dendrobium catenatum]